jgi:hypothetical protein
MPPRPFSAATQRQWLAASLLACPMVLWAQGAAMPSEQPVDWQRANEAVAEFPRGHVDVLKWERSNLPADPAAKPASQGLEVPDLAQATRLAWAAHRELVGVQSRAGAATVDTIVQGQWRQLDPSLQRRVKGLDELLAVAAQGRKAWLQAVAAHIAVQHQRATLDAAEAALALGQRMVAVGNWSKLQLAPVQLAKSTAHMGLARAQYAAAQSQAALLKTLRLSGAVAGVSLPNALPSLPAQPMTQADMAQRLHLLQGHMPRAEGQRHQGVAQLAMDAYMASQAVAQANQQEVVATRRFVVEEVQLHYNGMLKSTWDLLAEVGKQSQAAIDAINAHRDALMAETDLNWVLQGGSPDSFVSLSGGGESAPAAGH